MVARPVLSTVAILAGKRTSRDCENSNCRRDWLVYAIGLFDGTLAPPPPERAALGGFGGGNGSGAKGGGSADL
jgi:hypothetical protein